jgi:TonB family protein
MRGDALSAAGLPGGTADRNQAGGGRDDGYGAKIKACVQPGVSFPPPPRGAGGNPAAQYSISLKPDGQIADVRLTKSSGNINFDRAVETGIRRCNPFPRPPSAHYPAPSRRPVRSRARSRSRSVRRSKKRGAQSSRLCKKRTPQKATSSGHGQQPFLGKGRDCSLKPQPRSGAGV